MHRILCVAALLILSVVEVTAQSSAPQVADGQTAPLALSSEPNRTNLLVGSLSIGNLTDTNALSVNGSRLSDFTWSIQPRLALLGTRRHMHWSDRKSTRLNSS